MHSLKEEEGLTLLEILIAMIIFVTAYLFVSKMFIQSYRGMKKANKLSVAIRLGQNEMARLRGIKDPLYIGLTEKEIDKYEDSDNTRPLAGKSTESPKPFIVQEEFSQREVCRETREEIENKNGERFWGRKESAEAREMANVSETINYVRIVEREIVDEMPKLVQVWVTVTWTEPQVAEAEEENYVLTTYLTP